MIKRKYTKMEFQKNTLLCVYYSKHRMLSSLEHISHAIASVNLRLFYNTTHLFNI